MHGKTSTCVHRSGYEMEKMLMKVLPSVRSHGLSGAEIRGRGHVTGLTTICPTLVSLWNWHGLLDALHTAYLGARLARPIRRSQARPIMARTKCQNLIEFQIHAERLTV